MQAPRSSPATQLSFRAPTVRDGALLHEMVNQVGTLDLNSAYLYILLADRFGATCAIAETDGTPVGFLTGFIPPEQPDTYFVWQVGVLPEARGRDIARAMIVEVSSRHPEVRFVEATVSPSNTPSDALFRSVARHLGGAVNVNDGYPPTLFPSQHETEHLYRIGPFEVSP